MHKTPYQPTVLHLLGNTGAGKTTVMDCLTQRNPETVSSISIGRELRKKYPPGYFEGQAAPEKTEGEALQIYKDFVLESLDMRRKLIVVDGQPRRADQVTVVLAVTTSYIEIAREFLLIHASHGVRQNRLIDRDAGTQAGLSLAMARLNADYRNQYEVMIELASLGINLTICDTEVSSARSVAEKIEQMYHL